MPVEREANKPKFSDAHSRLIHPSLDQSPSLRAGFFVAGRRETLSGRTLGYRKKLNAGMLADR